MIHKKYKHKHYDMIVAWAAGETIESWSYTLNRWVEFTNKNSIEWNFEPSQYRIKPEPEPTKWSTLCSALVAIREYRFMPTPENQVDAENKFQEALRVIGESK